MGYSQSSHKNGETFEQAISYPSGKTKSKERIMFENHENPFNLSWDTVKFRLSKGEGFESAMNEPSGVGAIGKFNKNWILFHGKWEELDNLDMLFDKETTKNMLKSGIKADKLFKRKDL